MDRKPTETELELTKAIQTIENFKTRPIKKDSDVKIGCVTLVRVPHTNEIEFFALECAKKRGIILPGGKWEKGESFVQCAQRELVEEVGVLAIRYRLIFGGMSEEGYYTYAFTADFARQLPFDAKEGRLVHATWPQLQKSAFGGYYDLLEAAYTQPYFSL